MRVRLPTNEYKAMLWSHTQLDFLQVDSDIFEQRHISGDRIETMDYQMFIPCEIGPNEVAFVKVVKTNKMRDID